MTNCTYTPEAQCISINPKHTCGEQGDPLFTRIHHPQATLAELNPISIFINILLALTAALMVSTIARRDLLHGFCLAVGLLVAMPTDVRIEFGGSLPDITVQRAIMIALTIMWIAFTSAKKSHRTTASCLDLTYSLTDQPSSLHCPIDSPCSQY